eukprot:TRINITY_DN5609_c0_g1_i5.p1 TRINITY_DN5609_c0_g1~~TRINITY_DN5609_c0_g1_i5.p1  ORF type:complete len:175 (+),score=46.46 TRINITY_DN5609_c0_g1_i5:257-781(+)
MWGRDIFVEWEWDVSAGSVLLAVSDDDKAVCCSGCVVKAVTAGAEVTEWQMPVSVRCLAANAEIVAVLQNGSVYTCSPAQSVIRKLGAAAASCGYTFGLLLLEDGQVSSWGHCPDTDDETPDEIGGEGAVAVSAGFDFSCVGLESGRVVAWGQNSCGETDVPDFGGRGLMRQPV